MGAGELTREDMDTSMGGGEPKPEEVQTEVVEEVLEKKDEPVGEEAGEVVEEPKEEPKEGEESGQPETPEKEEENEDGSLDSDPKGVKKRLGKVTKKRRLAEKEADYQKGRADEAVAELDKVRKANSEPELVIPKEEDFDTHEEYTDALVEHRVALRLKEETTEPEVEEPEAPELTPEQQEEIEDFQDRMEEERDLQDDFDTITRNPKLDLTTSMLNAAQGSEVGAKIIYHLGKNLKDATRIAKLSRTAQVMEIGKLEERILNPTKNKKPTGAPPPIKPTSGGGTPPATDLGKMPIKDFMELRNGTAGK